MRLIDMAEKIGGTLIPGSINVDVELQGVAPIMSAGKDQISFLIAKEFEERAKEFQGGALIVAREIKGCKTNQIVHANPYYAFAIASQQFVIDEADFKGISDRAHINPSAIIGEQVTIYPNAYVGAGANIADHCILYPGVYIGPGAKVGSYTRIRANAVVEHGCEIGAYCLIHPGAVIGADGFGFAPGEKDVAKIPQVGTVKVADHVEIGPLVTIDRGTMDATQVGRGTKIDSQVHIAHNVKVGEHTMLCGGVFLAGSCEVGDWCILTGQAAVSNKVKIGNGITVAAKAGVTKNLKEPGIYGGYPAIPLKDWRRDIAHIRGIGKLKKQVMELMKAKSS